MIQAPPATAGSDFDPARLRHAFGQFATGVTVITTMTESGPVGITANSFTSVSLDPPLVLWSPARASSRFAAFAAARNFSIHVLAEHQADLSARFTRGGAGFDGLAFGRSTEGSPLLPGALARFDCTLHSTHDGGDHLIILGRVLRLDTAPGRPLVFAQGAYVGLAER